MTTHRLGIFPKQKVAAGKPLLLLFLEGSWVDTEGIAGAGAI